MKTYKVANCVCYCIYVQILNTVRYTFKGRSCRCRNSSKILCFVSFPIFASEANVFPAALSAPQPILLWSRIFSTRTPISQSFLQIISLVLIRSVTFFFVMPSSLCSPVSTLLRDHLMRPSPLLLRWGVLIKVEFHVQALFYWIHIQLTVHCSVY